MWGEIIGAVGSIGSAVIGGMAADDAADQQIHAINQAQGISAAAVKQARESLFQQFTPAFKDVQTSINASIGALQQGRTDAFDFLTRSSAETSKILGRTSSDAQNALVGGVNQARDDISAGLGAATRGYNRAQNQVQDWGLQALRAAGGGGYSGGGGGGGGGVGFDINSIHNYLGRGTNQAVNELSKYADTGEEALQREAALSGALGPEAQQRAQDEYIESPGQQYFREQQEKALLRSSAAIGGLGGGNVRSALQEQAMGIASQDQQRYLENLRSLSAQGLQAAGQQGDYRQQSAQTGANIAGSLQGQKMSADAMLSANSANIANQQAIHRSNLLSNMGINLGGLSVDAGLTQLGGAGDLSALANQGGINQANLIGQYGGLQANLSQSLGQQLANLADQGSINTANIIGPGGQNLGNMQMNLGTNLANNTIGQAGIRTQLQQNAGAAAAQGILGQATAYQAGLGGLGNVLGGMMPYSSYSQTQSPSNPFHYGGR